LPAVTPRTVDGSVLPSGRVRASAPTKVTAVFWVVGSAGLPVKLGPAGLLLRHHTP